MEVFGITGDPAETRYPKGQKRRKVSKVSIRNKRRRVVKREHSIDIRNIITMQHLNGNTIKCGVYQFDIMTEETQIDFLTNFEFSSDI